MVNGTAAGGDSSPVRPADRAAIGAIVQARMDSRRLPGKVLLEVAGKSVLEYVLERLERCPSLEAVVVATSGRRVDDPIAELAERRGTACFRGAPDDVLARIAAAARAHRLGAVVRVSADSPLLDRALVERAVSLLDGADVVTNVFPRSFPPGQSVEVVTAAALARLDAEASEPDDREHVTQFAYRHPGAFAIRNFASERSWGAVHLAVDTAADLETVRAIVARMERAHWEYGLEELPLAAAGAPA